MRSRRASLRPMLRLTKTVAASLLLVLFTGSCDGGGEADAGPDLLADRKREILASLATRVFLPSLEDFVVQAEALETATAAYAADPSDPNRDAAREAWRAAMGSWELVEVMQIGPAGMGGLTFGVVGGMDLRDEIYTYEQSSTCRIDQETVEGAYADPDTFAGELVNVRGLDALEYLLFTESVENTCSLMSPINTDGSWDALGADGVRAARAGYSATVATLVSRQAVALRDGWAPTGGDFVATLSNAGLDGNPYPSPQSAMSEIAGAMLYLDLDSRDMKLAEPAGIAGCLMATCPDALETPHAGYGGAALLANLRAFQLLYLGDAPGTEALGWDDLLVDVGAGELAAQLTAALEAAVTATEALGPSLQEAIATDPAAVMAAYDAISEVLRLFKTDLFTILDIEPGASFPADND